MTGAAGFHLAVRGAGIIAPQPPFLMHCSGFIHGFFDGEIFFPQFNFKLTYPRFRIFPEPQSGSHLNILPLRENSEYKFQI
jgi:hypothetical protein